MDNDGKNMTSSFPSSSIVDSPNSQTGENQLVWVTVGYTQHPAILLDDSRDEDVLVRWSTSQKKEWVNRLNVEYHLTPRKRKILDQAISNERTVRSENDISVKRSNNPCSELQSDETTPQASQRGQNFSAPASDLNVSSGTIYSSHIDLTNESCSDDDDDLDVTLTDISCREGVYKRVSLSPDIGSVNCAASNILPPYSTVEKHLGFLHEEQHTIVDTKRKVTSSNLGIRSVSDSFPFVAELADNKEAKDPPLDNVDDDPKYSLVSSAYLQNLAEICFSILTDVRWRVFNHRTHTVQDCLFDWRKGDDMSVVTELARLFQPMDCSDHLCTCILCRDESNSLKYDPSGLDSKFSLSQGKADNTGNHEPGDDTISSLYLFCRLFYRKGPWFRIDDVYHKYYSPKPIRRTEENVDEINLVSGTTELEENEKKCGKETFFNSSSLQSKRMPGNQSIVFFDESLLKRHISGVTRLFSDIDDLFAKGWIRSFHDEADCGKCIGLYLLTVDERRNILAKLGGITKNKKQSGFNHSTTATNGVAENEIWKQMKQQQSLCFDVKLKKSNILRVSHFVDDVVLNRLLESILNTCSIVDRVPPAVLKSKIDSIRSTVLELSRPVNARDGNVCARRMCFRLREEPSLTLQRVIRLYVCATSGPGNMRGDGTNGWRSLLDHSTESTKHRLTPLFSVVPPVGQNTWYQLRYPGLSFRFGLNSSPFRTAYVPHYSENTCFNLSELRLCQVFTSSKAFRAWEICVEFRAQVDYLTELNELLRYNQRRRNRSTVGGGDRPTLKTESVDLMGLLVNTNRGCFIKELLASVNGHCCDQIVSAVESQIRQTQDSLTNDCEKVLAILGIMAIHVLSFCNISLPFDEYKLIASRPWLRHLFWPSCLSYILWDIFPLFERTGLYKLAIEALEVLLFGNFPRIQGTSSLLLLPNVGNITLLSPLLLSRRAKGKAFDRLIIDYTHFHRKILSTETNKETKKAAAQAFQVRIMHFCKSIIDRFSEKSSIGFSAIRILARRLKQPLSNTIKDLECHEAIELGLRYENETCGGQIISDEKFYDWAPQTDRTVANALDSGNEATAGSRCAYVGFEDGDSDEINTSSLNVEQLAMEFYRTGRIPLETSNSSCEGGWRGFHDEGGHVRALFRILCSAPVLGMDWGCGSFPTNNDELKENTTIFLSPYQDAPFDLHVGFEFQEIETTEEKNQVPSRGFYQRRKHKIDRLLERLCCVDDQTLCDLVHSSVLSRLVFNMTMKQKDPFIERDCAKLRTLSLIAVGCGGQQLASIIRCLCYDYRHYSGGLPDLLLVRARYKDEGGITSDTLVDLDDWVGENSFPNDVNDARRASILIDRDDEYLGCSKVGDAGRSAVKTMSSSSVATNKTSRLLSRDMVGERLELQHNARAVAVECMLVEVKSSNDRLDPRQEDWLNILDKYGNARVCKFEKSKPSSK